MEIHLAKSKCLYLEHICRLVQISMKETSHEKNVSKSWADIFQKEQSSWPLNMKRCSTLLVMRKIHIKITMR